MIRIIAFVIALSVPVFLYAEVNNCGKLPLTEERLKAAMQLVSQQNFQEVINLLQQEKFESAKNILSVRINSLIDVFKNNWKVIDRDPGLVDCLFLRYMINILNNDTSAARSDCDLISKVQPAYGDTLRKRMPDFIDQARKDPGKYKEMIKESAKMIWLSKDVKTKK